MWKSGSVEKTDELPLLSRSSNAFAIDLWGEVRKTAPGNLALSPASITLALASHLRELAVYREER